MNAKRARPIFGPEPAIATDADLHSVIEILKSRLRIAVIFAGDKTAEGSVLFEAANARSWKSYEAVAADIAAALKAVGFKHVELMPEDMRLTDRLRRSGAHMAWLNTAGVQGFNSAAHAPSILEMLGVPYVGHEPLAATTLDNKHAFKREAVCAGLPTAPFSTWHMARGPFRPELNSRFQLAFEGYAGPFIVKPVSGRASLNVCVVEHRDDLGDAVAQTHEITSDVVLIEKYLPGREFCIAAAGPVTASHGRLSRRDGPFTFAAVERVLDDNEKIFTSMDLRPISGARCRAVDADAEPDLFSRLHEIAREVFLEFNLGSLIRLDIRADAVGNLYILEANPKPDLKRPAQGVTSLICEGLSESGMTYDDLILSLIADRLDFLLHHRRDGARHIVNLLAEGRPSSTRPGPRSRPLSSFVKGDVGSSIRALQETIAAAREAQRGGGFMDAVRQIERVRDLSQPQSTPLPLTVEPRSREASFMVRGGSKWPSFLGPLC